MKTIYYMATDIGEQSVYDKPIYYNKLMGVLIREYPSKYRAAVTALKEYLKGTPHITEHCDFPYKHIPIDKHDIHINNIKLGNFFILPYSKHIYTEIYNIVSCLNLPYTDICCGVFYVNDDIFPLKYSSNLGTIVINKENTDVVKYE